MSADPARIVVIGAGLIGQKHAAMVAAHSNCTLAGLCDIDPGRASVASEYDTRFFTEIESLLDSTEPDGAIIATPNGLHAEAADACAARHIHMLIEKPIADTVASAQRIAAVAEAASVQVLVGHHRRYNPLVQAARAAIRKGDLGQLVGVSVHWMLKKPDDYFDVLWRGERPGGGPALINMIHDIDNLRYICGEIDQVYAQTSSAVRGLPVEDALSGTLRFANGALGTILAADTTPAPWSYELTTGENPVYPQIDENCYFFTGTHGALSFPRMSLWRYPSGKPDGWHQPLQESHLQIAPNNPLELQLSHFCRVIRNQEAPVIDALDATASLAVVLAILESAQTGQAVEVTMGREA